MLDCPADVDGPGKFQPKKDGFAGDALELEDCASPPGCIVVVAVPEVRRAMLAGVGEIPS